MRVSPLRTISGRVVLGFLVLVATFVAVTVHTVLGMDELGRDLRLTRTAYLEVTLNAAQLLARQDNAVDYLEINREKVLRGEVSRTKGAVNLRFRLRLLQQSKENLAGLPMLRGDQRAEVDELQAKIDSFVTLYEKVDGMYDRAYAQGLTPDEHKVAVDALIRKEKSVQSLVLRWFNDLRRETIRTAARLEASERQARYMAIILGGVATFIGLLVIAGAVWTLRPIGRLRDGVRKVAGGDYRERLSTKGTTEVSEVAREFNAMAAALEQREQELIRSERLAAVGKMAAVITHEVRNPLSSIGLNTELLAEEVKGSAEAASLCAAIQKEVDRLTAITEEYLRFARLPRPKLDREQVSSIVAGLVEFQREELALRGVTIAAELADDLPPVQADEAQLRQALLNLVRNGADAMAREGGTLTLRTSLRGGEVEVRVIDTGPGIPPHNLPRIFEPFFSTKEGGTGLGLALTQQIILEHGGRIGVEPGDEGRGTAFVIRLPAAPAVPTAATAASA